MTTNKRGRGITVNELIADTIWIPGRDYAGARPPVLTVTLPTCRRGADGAFRRAAASVLGQTFTDLELIIIDDASTDGTADVIAELMESDGRVSCLRHPRNIGLPAISEFEAYRRARGSYLGFAFDDCVFEPDAYEHLVAVAREHPPALVHGHLEWPDGSGGWRRLGANKGSYGALGYGNIIGNATVVLAREVIEAVGLYDPHIGLSRLCDWDFWRRIVRKFPVLEVDRLVAVEFGVVRPDSLGNTYPMRPEIMQEFLELDRDEDLRPGRFGERDVWAAIEGGSLLLDTHIIAVQRFFAAKPWAQGLAPQDGPVDGAQRRRVIGVFSEQSASTCLCIDGLPKSDSFVVMRIEPFATSKEYCTLQLLACDVVVFSRDLFRPGFREAIGFCRAHGIPHYWFIDDNFMLLAEEFEDLADFSEERVRSELATFAGVLASSDTLVALMSERSLHGNAHYFGPIVDPARLLDSARRASDSFTVASVGGGFRSGSLVKSLIPILAQLAADGPVRLVARHTTELANALPARLPFEVTLIDAVVEFDAYVRRWSAEAIDVVVHTAGRTRNLNYKTPNVLLTAAYLGAVPVVANEAVFAGMGESEGVIRIDDDADWARALARLADPELRRTLVARLRRFIQHRFDPARNVATFEAVAAGVQPQDWLSREDRLRSVIEKSPAYVAARAPQPRVLTALTLAPAPTTVSVRPPLLAAPASGRIRGRQSTVASGPRLTGATLRPPRGTSLVITVSSSVRPDLPLRSASLPSPGPDGLSAVSWPAIEASEGQRFLFTIREATARRRFRRPPSLGSRHFVLETLHYG